MVGLFYARVSSVCILGLMSILGIELSAGAIGAMLMMIGYSTDSDILLATNIIKRREGTLEERMKRAIKSEITMGVAAFVAFFVMYSLSTIEVIKQIAIILLFGLIFDVINTWLGNAGFQRLYLEYKKKKE